MNGEAMADDNKSQDSGANDTGKSSADGVQAQAAAVPAPDDQSLQATNLLDGAGDQSVGAELLHAALALPPDAVAEAIAHVELTLDQLGNTVDLFDVPPFDYGDAGDAT